MSNLSIITEADRTERGHLLPEAEERVVRELVESLPKMKKFSALGIANELNI